MRRFTFALELALSLALAWATACASGAAPGDDDADASTPDAPPPPPEIEVGPAMLDYGNPLVNVDYDLTVTVENVGGSDLHVTEVELMESGGTQELTVVPGGAVGLTIAPGDSASLAVTLHAVDGQVDDGELRISSDDADEPVVVVPITSRIEGQADLELTPTAIDFGLVSYGTTNVRDVDVRNTGTVNAPLGITNAIITNTTGEGGLYSVEAFWVADDGTETPTLLPVFLSQGDSKHPADKLRLRVTFVANTANPGPAPDEELILTTTDVDPQEATAHLPITGSVIGCSMPVPETCNGLDDDCDLVADEDDPGSGAACDSGQPGICAPGVEHCIGGSLQCVPDQMPQAESCNDIDDNCNGATDESLIRPCMNACGDGGVEFCLSGVFTGCNAPPVPAESCDGVDNDCDGATDEGNPGGGGACSTMMPGICAAGTLQCMGASGLVCVPHNTPTTEACNLLDDDCNGVVDNGDPGGGAACATGLPGICAAGTFHCLSGSVQCQQNQPAVTESCNLLDDDCNGVVDNGFNLTSDVNNCGSCGNICSVANAVEVCSSSNCAIAACTGNNVDTDGAYATGCECADDATEVTAGNGDGCAASVVVGTLVEGGQVTVSGKIATVGDEDWYQIGFTDSADSGGGACDPFRPNISFSSNPGGAYRFQVFNTDCSANATCAGASLTQFTYFSGAGTNHCCHNTASPGPGQSQCVNQSQTLRLRVIRTTATATCDTYSLLIKNGP